MVWISLSCEPRIHLYSFDIALYNSGVSAVNIHRLFLFRSLPPKGPIQVSDGVAKRNGLAEKYWESKSRISQLDAHNNAIFLKTQNIGTFLTGLQQNVKYFISFCMSLGVNYLVGILSAEPRGKNVS